MFVCLYTWLQYNKMCTFLVRLGPGVETVLRLNTAAVNSSVFFTLSPHCRALYDTSLDMIEILPDHSESVKFNISALRGTRAGSQELAFEIVDNMDNNNLISFAEWRFLFT